MNGIGLDCGTATVKLAMLSQERELLWFKSSAHHGAAVQTVRALLGELLQADSNACGYPVMLTGSIGNRLLDVCPGLLTLGDIPAIHRGIHLLAPEAKSVIEIGSQSARFLTALDCGTPPRFAVNEHCAGGTGSFFEDQMSRLGLRIEDYSELVAKARSIPRLSGRCAVFAKTDIIHRQQEGVPTPDILLGLCYAMVRNYKAVIVRGLSVEKPVALCGGVGYNAGVLRAIRDVFGLTEEELILPKNFLYAGAAGAALAAQEAGTCSMGELLASLCGQDSNTEDRLHRRQPLGPDPKVFVSDPPVSGHIPPQGCALGIDVGSTSTVSAGEKVNLSRTRRKFPFWQLASLAPDESGSAGSSVRMPCEMRLQPKQELPSNVCPKQIPSLRSAVKILNTSPFRMGRLQTFK